VRTVILTGDIWLRGYIPPLGNAYTMNRRPLVQAALALAIAAAMASASLSASAGNVLRAVSQGSIGVGPLTDELQDSPVPGDEPGESQEGVRGGAVETSGLLRAFGRRALA
jgi:hypothetical protein